MCSALLPVVDQLLPSGRKKELVVRAPLVDTFASHSSRIANCVAYRPRPLAQKTAETAYTIVSTNDERHARI